MTLGLFPSPGNDDIPEDVRRALYIWLSFGGAGKRSRRGFGSFRLIKTNDIPESMPEDGQKIAEQAREYLTQAIVPNLQPSATDPHPIPDFPCFVTGHSLTLICTAKIADSYEEAMKRFWIDHLRNAPKGLLSNEAYGYARNDRRRASPLHLHLARSKKGYHLVLTAFNSDPPASRDSWEKVKKLLNSCCQEYEGEWVWGKGE